MGQVNFIFILLFCFVLFCSITNAKNIIHTVAGVPPFGGDGGFATRANLYYPYSSFLSSNNELYIADYGNNVIRKVDRKGIITTVAGTPGLKGTSGNGGLAINAQLALPKFMFVNPNNELHIAEANYVRKVLSNGTIVGVAGYGSELADGKLAIESSLNLNCLFGVEDEIYLCDRGLVRKIFSNGTIITVAGKRGSLDNIGDGDLATNTTLKLTSSIFVTKDNEMYISEQDSYVIRKVFRNGTIITFAGMYDQSGCSGDGGLAIKAQIGIPKNIVVNQEGDVIFADSSCNVIRKIQMNTTIITTIAGVPGAGYSGDNGDAKLAKLNIPNGVIVSPENELFIADNANHVIRKIDKQGIITTFAGYNPSSDTIEPKLKFVNLNTPEYIYISQKKEIYVSDKNNYFIKRFSEDGSVEILAGKAGGITGENIPATSAKINPGSITVNETNRDVFFVNSNSIKRVRNGTLSTYIGPTVGAIVAPLYTPSYILLDNQTNSLYMVETVGHVVRRVFTNGTIEKVAGNLSVAGNSGDGGLATNATLLSPLQLTIAPNRDIYILDRMYTIRRVFSNGTITTVDIRSNITSIKAKYILAHSTELYLLDATTVWKSYLNGTTVAIAGTGTAGFSGDGGDPLLARLYQPYSLQVMFDGTMYIADSLNNIIRKITNVCTQFSIIPSLSIQNLNNQSLAISTHINRTCVEYSPQQDYYVPKYIPSLNVMYKSTGAEVKAVAMDWDTQNNQSVPIVGQFLDTLSILLDGCSTVENIKSNCSSATEYGIIPTSSTSNFLLFPEVVSANVINYFRTSPEVTLLKISLSFNNSNTNIIDKTQIIYEGLKSFKVNGLQHSTTYIVRIATEVQYANGFKFQSPTIEHTIITEIGKLPLGTVPNFAVNLQEAKLLITWDSIPVENRGNTPITKLLLEIVVNNLDAAETVWKEIQYDAEKHNPTSYEIDIFQNNIQYSLRIAACNAIGCGNYSDVITTTYIKEEQPNNTNSVVPIVVPIVVAICFLLSCFMILFLSILILIFVLLQRKVFSKRPEVYNEHELFEQLTSKEFIIDEFKLDLQSSTFIGSGASGSVITAKYFNIDVAIKLMQKSTMGIESDMSDFYNELKFMNQNAHHQNIIRFFGVYQTADKIGLVMELCKNGSIASYISKFTLDFATKLNFIKGIANGMRYLHHFNIAHRDLKCENVLLDESLTPKIIDFGYSKEIVAEANKSLHMTMNIGTAVYCAPEVFQLQLAEKPASPSGIESIENVSKSSSTTEKRLVYDKKCDVYSFAIIIFVIYFQNNTPYGKNVTDTQIMYQLSKNINLRPKFDESKIPQNEKWLIDLMVQCWQTNPIDRFSFEQICECLQKHGTK